MAAKKASSQVAKFRAAARELGTDNSEKRFNEKLGKIANAKPKGSPTKRPKKS
jgi:hypothetical protein